MTRPRGMGFLLRTCWRRRGKEKRGDSPWRSPRSLGSGVFFGTFSRPVEQGAQVNAQGVVEDVVDLKEPPAGEQLGGLDQAGEQEAHEKHPPWALPQGAQRHPQGQQHEDIEDDVF